jgi:hypothetical protein
MKQRLPLAGDYTCQVTLNGCARVSNIITLTYGTPSAVIINSGPTSVCSGGYVLMLAYPSTAGNTYQWRRNNVRRCYGITFRFTQCRLTKKYKSEDLLQCGDDGSPIRVFTVCNEYII